MYFNQLFGVSAIKMRKLGVFNGNVKTDNKMFVDPKLLEDAKGEFLGAHGDIVRHFSAVVELIKKVKTESLKDPYFFAAVRAMRFKETSNTGLGCSAIGKDGNGIGKVLATRIVKQAILILPHVDFQPEVLEMIGVFTEGLGCDRISDMIVALLKDRFVKYTSRVTSELQIQKTVKIQFQGKTYVCPQTAKRAGSANSDRGISGGSVLRQPKMAEKRRADEQASAQEPLSSVQGEGGLGRSQG